MIAHDFGRSDPEVRSTTTLSAYDPPVVDEFLATTFEAKTMMKLCLISLLTMLAASLAVNGGNHPPANSPAVAPPGRSGSSGLLSAATIPISRSFRCPIVLSAANNWTAATTVPSGMAFALSSLTLTDSTGNLLVFQLPQQRRELRIVGGLCSETVTLPTDFSGNYAVGKIPLSQRKIEFDPPLLFFPGDPFEISIGSFFLSSSGDYLPSPLTVETLSLVVGGYVLYPGEY